MQSGTRIGPYEIVASLGAGGMGEVYRARDMKLQRDVALKILPDTFATDAERLARFEREARTLAALNHPHIAHIYGFEHAQGTHALVMELVEGEDLAERIARGPIPVDDALPIARQIAEGLAAAHEQGIVHRDLKPANVKVRPDGVVKVLDFGLAKACEPVSTRGVDATVSPTITSPAIMTGVGMLLGTAAYMSPEQARGKPVDRRADIWAFGCVLYEMLTGRRAFEDEDVSLTLSKVLQREPDFGCFPEEVPAHVRQTVRLCLRKPLTERVPDIGAVRLALDGAFEAVPPTPPVTVSAPPMWRRAFPLATAALLASVVTGLVGWSLRPSSPPAAVSRFDHQLPMGATFRTNGTSPVTISRDGRHFTFNTTRGLYLRALNALEPRLIPGTEGEAVAPIFSPDGDSLAFFQDRSLKRVSVRGGAARVIAGMQTSSNGTLEDMRGPFTLSWDVDDVILIGHSDGVSRVAADGGTPELLIRAEPGQVFHGPRLLPGGDTLLFTVTTTVGPTRWDEADIVAQSLATGQRTTIVKGGSDARYLPTGHLIYALADALFAVPFDPRDRQVRGPSQSVLDGVGRPGNLATSNGAAFYDVSAAGALVYARAGAVGFLGFLDNDQNTLVWVDREGREEPLRAAPRPYVYPRISPDGSRLAVDVRDQSGDIWIWDFRRQNSTRLTSAPSVDGLPLWTPDGERLVWMSARATGVLNLYWQRADGTGMPERLTDSPNAHRPNSFTPDGKRIVLSVQSAGRQDLAVLSLDRDRALTPLIQGEFDQQNGEISPDGRWLAYESNEAGRFEVYVQPFPDVDRSRTTISTAGGRQPAWSRSARELFYIAADNALMAVAIDAPRGSTTLVAGAPVKLHDGADYYDAENTPNRGRTYDISPDGTRFIRIKRDLSQASGTRGSLVVVVNWFEELKRLAPAK